MASPAYFSGAIICSLLVSFSSGKPFSGVIKTHNKEFSESRNKLVNTLGQLESLHVVGIATHPSDSNKLLYADETSIYEFDKSTAESVHIAGGVSGGLKVDRRSRDGTGLDASFTYITKIVSRASGLYIFDFDRLRKLDLTNKVVTTVSILLDDETVPVLGTISQFEDQVFWCGIGGEGHFVMKAPLTAELLSRAERLVAGPSLIGYMEVSFDTRSLYLADMDMQVYEKVDVESGDFSFMTAYDNEYFVPGAMAAVSSTEFLAIDRATRTISRYQVSTDPATVSLACSDDCIDAIANPFDLTVDTDGNIYVLDTEPHPTYPTYQFFIREIASPRKQMLTTTTTTTTTTTKPVVDTSRIYNIGNKLRDWYKQLKNSRNKLV